MLRATDVQYESDTTNQEEDVPVEYHFGNEKKQKRKSILSRLTEVEEVPLVVVDARDWLEQHPVDSQDESEVYAPKLPDTMTIGQLAVRRNIWG